MRKITVKPGCAARYDDTSPFLIGGGGLEIEFDMTSTNSENYFVCSINDFKCTLPITNQHVSMDHLEAGELRAEIKRFLRGELIETIPVEPLLLKRVNTDFSATPAFVELRTKLDQAVKKLSSQTAAYNTAVAAYNAAVERINNIDERLAALESNYDPTVIR